MRRPVLSRMFEAYIPVSIPAGTDLWDAYVVCLCSTVAPAVRDLIKDRYITWYCFLLHQCPGSLEPCVHLRVCAAANRTEEDLRLRLGVAQVFRRAGSVAALAGVDSSVLLRGVPEAWQLLGKCSELVLALVGASATGSPAAQTNARQWMHFLCNQLQGSLLGECK